VVYHPLRADQHLGMRVVRDVAASGSPVCCRWRATVADPCPRLSHAVGSDIVAAVRAATIAATETAPAV
jgi:hypothetical protein